jgi:hypothetical protein
MQYGKKRSECGGEPLQKKRFVNENKTLARNKTNIYVA